MKQKSDWKRITLLRKTSLQERDQKYWPLINGDSEAIQLGNDRISTGKLASRQEIKR